MHAFVVTVCIIVLLVFGSASAEEKAILLLDGSGSMWGKVDGQHKIDIARNVIGQVLDDIPPERSLGLVAYGHNRKGDCGDIEELAPVGSARSDIRNAVQQLMPRGKTPISDAVVFAAEKLRYSEEAATVILVSDGIETCAADPCEVARRLESSGVDFTVHVIGFDID